MTKLAYALVLDVIQVLMVDRNYLQSCQGKHSSLHAYFHFLSRALSLSLSRSRSLALALSLSGQRVDDWIV